MCLAFANIVKYLCLLVNVNFVVFIHININIIIVLTLQTLGLHTLWLALHQHTFWMCHRICMKKKSGNMNLNGFYGIYCIQCLWQKKCSTYQQELFSIAYNPVTWNSYYFSFLSLPLSFIILPLTQPLPLCLKSILCVVFHGMMVFHIPFIVHFKIWSTV